MCSLLFLANNLILVCTKAPHISHASNMYAKKLMRKWNTKKINVLSISTEQSMENVCPVRVCVCNGHAVYENVTEMRENESRSVPALFGCNNVNI